MGACILVAMKPLLDHLGELEATTAFWWLIGGGVSYIVGAVFYSLRKPYMHATFHLFCLGGSIGLFRFDLVAWICGGQASVVARVIYTLVGLAGIWCITMLFREKEPMESGGQT